MCWGNILSWCMAKAIRQQINTVGCFAHERPRAAMCYNMYGWETYVHGWSHKANSDRMTIMAWHICGTMYDELRQFEKPKTKTCNNKRCTQASKHRSSGASTTNQCDMCLRDHSQCLFAWKKKPAVTPWWRGFCFVFVCVWAETSVSAHTYYSMSAILLLEQFPFQG